ncbi:MAG: PIN domain-containing protein [Thermoanaerobaculia bacterium]|nr:PIN domain-containing protein [Thermoanaerobaculia bacterium]
MPGEQLLLDTGALVALLDRSQPQHRDFVSFFESWRGAVVSTEAVLTEATHLLGRVPGGRERCLEFFLEGGAVLVPSNRSSLHRCRDLIAKYSDQDMDFADATLVVLAEELETGLVFTTDRRDFAVYRINGREPFKILPEL